MARELDFFFFYGSTYTFLSVLRISKLAKAAEVKLRWRPFNVRQIMIEMDNRPFASKPIKSSYMWRDIERRAALHSIPFKGSPKFPADPDLMANKVGIVAAEQGWCPEYSVASYESWFLKNQPLGEINSLIEILALLGKNVGAVLEEATSEKTAKIYDAETEVAKELGIFGSPTFASDTEIFWGDDRLEEAIAWSTAS